MMKTSLCKRAFRQIFVWYEETSDLFNLFEYI